MFGPAGRYWPELKSLEEVWRCAFLDQYPDGEHASKASVKRYCAGWSRFSSRLRKRYAQPDGLEALIQNMERVVGSSGSMSQVLRIQKGVHDWLEKAAVDKIDVNAINQYFVSENASMEEVAIYLATVMHQIIVAS